MPSLEFGLVGYGAWGSCHAQAIRETPGCELRAICAQTVESRARAARETGVEVVADFRTLIERRDIAVLDIVVPNFLHAELATLALEGGKHVLLEKPMAITVEGCDAIIAAWRRSAKLLLVGHEMRFSPLHRRMWEIVQDGSVGELRYLLMDLWRRPYRPGAGGWRSDPARVGNWTLEEPVHFFEATSWLLGPEAVPIAVYASGASNGSAGDLRPSMVDHFTATVRYNSGAYAVISQTLGAVEHHLSIKKLSINNCNN